MLRSNTKFVNQRQAVTVTKLFNPSLIQKTMYICGSRNIVTRAIQKVVVSLFPLLMLDADTGALVRTFRPEHPAMINLIDTNGNNKLVLSVVEEIPSDSKR